MNSERKSKSLSFPLNQLISNHIESYNAFLSFVGTSVISKEVTFLSASVGTKLVSHLTMVFISALSS